MERSKETESVETQPAGKGVGVSAVSSEDIAAARGLVEFIESCPSMFHTVQALRSRLDAAGFSYLPEGEPWHVSRGDRCYTVRNNSSLIAFKVGAALDSYHFQVAASHTDSPTFKVKAEGELVGPADTLRLNVEVYGGAVDYTWFDRPLGLAGRVMVRDGARVESRLYESAADVALIPSMPPHIQRDINQSFGPNRQVDLCPVVSAGFLAKGSLDELIARDLGVRAGDIIARDLFLVNRQKPCIWGWENEFVSAPKLDDLACVYTSLEAFLAADNPHDIAVLACFDNEEVGSNTKQGAMSTFLVDALARLNDALGRAPEDLRCALAKSMLVSCDNAHAVNPNHPEKYDEANRCALNRGIVVKEAANQKYCTDAFSRAAFLAVCDDAGVPYQTFANRSDMPGGSTLGNLSNIQVSMHAVDVGIAQYAMHSSFETAGARDIANATRALSAFFKANIVIDGADGAEIS